MAHLEHRQPILEARHEITHSEQSRQKHQQMVPVHERGLIHQKRLIPPSDQTLPLWSCLQNKTSQGKAKWTDQRTPIWTKIKQFARKQWKNFTTTRWWTPTKETTKNNRKPNKIQRSHGEPNKEKTREKTTQVQSSWYGSSKNWQSRQNNPSAPQHVTGKSNLNWTMQFFANSHSVWENKHSNFSFTVISLFSH